MSLLIKILVRHKMLLGALIAVGLVSAVLEGLGLALIFPLIQGMAPVGSAPAMPSSLSFPFDRMQGFLSGMTFERRLQLIAVLLLIITVVKNIFIYAGIALGTRLQVLAVRETRMQCVQQVMNAGISYFHKQKMSYFQLIFLNHTEAALGTTINRLADGLVKFFTVLVLLAFLLILSWKMTLMSLVFVAVFSLLTRKLVHKVLAYGAVVNTARHDFNTVLLEIIHGMKLIRQFNRQQYMIDRFSRSVDGFNAALSKAVNLSLSVAPVFETVGTGILCLILLGGSVIVTHNAAWMGILFTFIVIMSRMIPPVKALNQTFAALAERMSSLNELDQFLHADNKEVIRNGARVLARMEQGIELRHVEFQYNPEHPVVLKDVSLRIPKGAKVGIVGPSGSGKSTLIELLMHFYDPQRGAILIDGIDLKELDVSSWRKHIGIVGQDNFLFSDTIRANITFPAPDTTQARLEEVTRLAYLEDFIKTLPLGYDTVVGERGVLLSGGQKQRLAIARAVLVDPEILIFDEATSALDAESEQIVQKAMDEISRGKTVLTIAHRLATIKNADIIVVLDQGRIMESGTHEDLLEGRGLYRKLVDLQSLNI